MTDYKVGERPWYAHYTRHEEVRVPCPVCYGKREVTLILGNDDQVTLPCDYCGKGYDAPTGYVHEYETRTKAERITITGVTTNETEHGQKREYWSCSQIFQPEDLFDTEEEANIRAAEKAEIDRIKHETSAEYIKKDKLKTFSWNAGYHMREAKNHRRQIEYHERRAVLCKARSKDGHEWCAQWESAGADHD